MNKKVIIKTALFAVIFIGLFIIFEKILSDKWVSEKVIHKYVSFYDLPSNTLDYIVLGASTGYFSINPMIIYAQEGYTGYTLASPVQTVELSYYWLQEACKYQKPKYVFYDVNGLFYNEEDKNADYLIKGMTYMRPSMLKIQAAYECKLSDMDAIQLLSPMYTFHSRWKQLTMDDFKINEYYYPDKGASMVFSVRKDTEKNYANNTEYLLYTDDNEVLQQVEINEHNAEVFDKIYSFCMERGIKLVPIKCPSMYWNEDKTKKVKEWLTNYNLEFLNIGINEAGINWDVDTFDTGYHTNYWGGCKASHCLKEYLNKESKLIDHRNEAGYEVWDDDLMIYRRNEEENLLTNVEKVLLYMQILEKNKEDLCIIFSVKDEMCSNWKQESQNFMERLGLTSDFFNNVQNSYIGIVDGGNIILDNFAEYPMRAEIEMKLNNGEVCPLKVESGGLLYGNTSKICVGDADYSLNNRGINIVAIDKNEGKVISAFSVDTWSPNWEFIEKIWEDELWEECRERGEQLLEDGVYVASPIRKQNYALSILTEKEEKKNILNLKSINNGDSQHFRLQYCGNGLYEICLEDSEKYLTVENFGNTSGNNIVLEKYTGLSNQKWYFFENDDGKYTIMSHYNRLIIDIIDTVPELKVRMNESNNENEQQFVFKKVA